MRKGKSIIGFFLTFDFLNIFSSFNGFLVSPSSLKVGFKGCRWCAVPIKQFFESNQYSLFDIFEGSRSSWTYSESFRTVLEILCLFFLFDIFVDPTTTQHDTETPDPGQPPSRGRNTPWGSPLTSTTAGTLTWGAPGRAQSLSGV